MPRRQSITTSMARPQIAGNQDFTTPLSASSMVTTPASVVCNTSGSSSVIATPKLIVENNGAIPKKVKFDEVPASQPQTMNWRDSRSFSIDAPESDDEWNISRLLSNLHLTPSTIATIPNRQTEPQIATALANDTFTIPAPRPTPTQIQSIENEVQSHANTTYTISSNTPITSCRANESRTPIAPNRQLQPRPIMQYQNTVHHPYPYPLVNTMWIPNYGQLHPNMMPRPFPYCQFMRPPIVPLMQLQNASQVTQPTRQGSRIESKWKFEFKYESRK